MSPGPALVGNYVLYLAVRQLVVYLAWILAAALAGAAACWCCGYGAQAAWSKAESSRRAWLAARHREEPDADPVTEEVARGIDEIEKFLADQPAQSVQSVEPVRPIVLPKPDRVDEDEPG